MAIRSRLPREFIPWTPLHNYPRFLISLQLGAERGRTLHHRSTRHEPHQPTIQGCHYRKYLQTQEPVATALRSRSPFNPSIRVILLPFTRPMTRNTKLFMINSFRPPGAPRLRTLWNVFALLRMPPLWTPSIPPLPSSLPTDWISPGVFLSMESSSRRH